MITMEKLKDLNKGTLDPCFINAADVNAINDCIALIEDTRTKDVPKVGDILRFTDEYGTYYGDALISSIEEDETAYICETPFIPYFLYAEPDKKSFSLSTSGGAWDYIPLEQCTYLGKASRSFYLPHSGIEFGNRILFESSVSVWEYIAPQSHIGKDGTVYTTKDYNRYYISRDLRKNRDYKYTSFLTGDAWKNDLELQSFIYTFRGKVFKGVEGQIVVFTWKERQIHVSPKEYENINGIEDTFIMNGKRRCKRVYDEKHHIVETYFVWYWKESLSDDESLDVFLARSEEQNKIIETYLTDNSLYANARSKIIAGQVCPVNLSGYFAKI